MQSEKTDQLALALSKVQASLRPALRTSTNPFFHSKYAPLDVVWDACRSQLGANGFAVTQTTSVAPASLVTTLLHSSGQWISGNYPLPEIQDPQKFASAVTYARRYALASLIGVVSPEKTMMAILHPPESPHRKSVWLQQSQLQPQLPKPRRRSATSPRCLMPRWCLSRQTKTPSGSWRQNSRSGNTKANGSRMHPRSQSNGMSRTSSPKPSTPTASTFARL